MGHLVQLELDHSETTVLAGPGSLGSLKNGSVMNIVDVADGNIAKIYTLPQCVVWFGLESRTYAYVFMNAIPLY